MASTRTVIFDLDGTLVDSAPGIITAFREVLAAHQIEPRVPLDNCLIGPPLAETMARLTGETNTAKLVALAEAFKSAYDGTGVSATPAYPGIDKLLAELQQRQMTLHVATNKRIAPTLAILERLGWTKYFSSVYALDLYQPRLADKAVLLTHLLAEQELTPAACIYIGDKHEDGAAADQNGIAFVAATWGYGDFASTACAAHWQSARSPKHLQELLIA